MRGQGTLGRLLLAALLLGVASVPPAAGAPDCQEQSHYPHAYAKACSQTTSEGHARWAIVHVPVPSHENVLPWGSYLLLRVDLIADDRCCAEKNDARAKSESNLGQPMVDRAWVRVVTEKPDSRTGCQAYAEGSVLPRQAVALPCWLTPGLLP